jgi:hypothetical protein
MTLPEAVQRIVARMRANPRKPFALIAPDGRVFLAPTYRDLLEISAREFYPELKLPAKES